MLSKYKLNDTNEVKLLHECRPKQLSQPQHPQRPQHYPTSTSGFRSLSALANLFYTTANARTYFKQCLQRTKPLSEHGYQCQKLPIRATNSSTCAFKVAAQTMVYIQCIINEQNVYLFSWILGMLRTQAVTYDTTVE